MLEVFLRLLVLIVAMLVFDAIRLLGGLLILKINSKSKFGFKVYAMSAASSFGCFGDDIARRCNLDKPCEDCRLWTCSKWHKSK